MASAMSSERTHRPFQTCGSCRHAWITWDSFVMDPAVRLLGFQSVLTKPDFNLLVFEHSCGSSISILSKRLSHLLPEPEPGAPTESLRGTQACRGHCGRLEDLEACDAHCINALERQLIFIVQRMKGREHASAL